MQIRAVKFFAMAVGLSFAFCWWQAAQAQTKTPSSNRAAAKVPRLADGHPDLNGTWDNGGGIDFIKPQTLPDGSVCVAGCGGKPPDMPPPNLPMYKPEYQAKVADLKKQQVKLDPALSCKPPGLPRIGPPDKIVQIPGQVVFLYDDINGSFFRIIPTDGRRHREDVDESYFGDAVGRWEGDTLVVDTVNFNDDSWLTDNGAFHTTALHVTERLRRTGNTIEYRAVAEDPKVLTKPYELRPRILQLTDMELAETPPCREQDLKHMVDESHHDNPR